VSLTFLLLCLASRVAYSFNDVWVGQLARRHDPTEIAALRGVSLGLTMAPLLAFVPAAAWPLLFPRLGEVLVLVLVTAGSNLLQLHAARYLPFGLRASLTVSSLAVLGIAFGVAFLGERLGQAELFWCALIVLSAALSARGDHSNVELTPDIPKGAAFAFGSSALMSTAALLLLRLSRDTHPLLAAWAWEVGSGLVLVPFLLLRHRTLGRGIGSRFLRVGIASLPTVLGSGASALALTRGPLGLWGALAGTQTLFTALLGASLHGEKLGLKRWLCFALGAGAVFGLMLAHP
jgi:drug/metabolite transporter (DMT)-like permease